MFIVTDNNLKAVIDRGVIQASRLAEQEMPPGDTGSVIVDETVAMSTVKSNILNAMKNQAILPNSYDKNNSLKLNIVRFSCNSVTLIGGTENLKCLRDYRVKLGDSLYIEQAADINIIDTNDTTTTTTTNGSGNDNDKKDSTENEKPKEKEKENGNENKVIDVIGGICPAGLSSVMGMNESLVGYATARFIGAYTTHNNGIGWQVCGAFHTTNSALIDGLIAAKLIVLFITVVGFFEYTFASIIGALTSAVPPDN